jgi:hypothetical protein
LIAYLGPDDLPVGHWCNARWCNWAVHVALIFGMEIWRPWLAATISTYGQLQTL